MTLDGDACYAALLARDARFDGLFFVGVTTTGIYCRPICTARTPGPGRCRYFRCAVDAEKAGFRACLRCRPELAPGGAPVDAVSRLVAAALGRIQEGALNHGSVDEIAHDLGVSGRHLRRAMERELGVSPVELAQSRRLATAKQLLHDTRLPLTEIALASGFRSVRRFNALFRERFGRAPSALRRGAPSGDAGLVVRLDFRPPYDWAHLLEFLGRRAVPGVEAAVDGVYRRVVTVGDSVGTVAVSLDPRRASLRAALSASLARHVTDVVAVLRRVFDLDARPDAIGAALAADPLLAPLIAARPGLRLPGAADPFELGVRALLGQQVSVRAATTLAGRLVARVGRPLVSPDGVLTHAFPTAGAIASLDVAALAGIGLPRARAQSLHGFAAAVASGAIALRRHRDPDEIMAELRRLPGIGDWTAHYVAMRGLHVPDAFVASDLGVRKALDGASPSVALRRAEAWRPWRSYAVMHLWASL